MTSTHTHRSTVLSRLLAPLMVLALVTSGCVADDTDRIDEKFKFTISETFQEPPGVVVDLVDSTVDSLRLQIMSRVLTSIDGRFEVRSAMGDDYRVVVEGMRTDRTRVAIDMMHRKHEDRAQLILTEIRSRIQLLRGTAHADNPGG